MVSTTDVAKHAGVSQTTVSRVLNKPDQVKKDTYDKVMAAVNELNYSATTPEDAVREARTTNTISLIAGPLDDPIFIGSAPSIISMAKEQGYQVNVHFVTKENELETYDTVIASKADGLILTSIGLDEAAYKKLSQSKIPFILLNSNYPDSQHSIGLNNVEAGYLAASHLLGSKHQEIAWIGGPLNNPTYKERFQGFIYALQEAKSKIRKKRLVIADRDKASLYNAFEDLQALKKKPTAIVAATDEIAIQLLDFYREAGYQIPGELSIIGIGNSEIGQHSALGLTSVGTADSLANLGQEAINRLLDMLTLEQNEAFTVSREVQLYERGTTAPLSKK
ncbi:LacI family transcriptional regulator/LacI family purine nucleotide synthesis repressor [Planomicrobium stackebrandtii]|uniref:LacI family transcriptional regulator/LacI family purine nucleotide synthesis repressor n=1 Tax=Planomicrobium stackebrandtii TaxID=253160 RepID=A0ABU0GQU5_9BACL|nr:LacI family DNA-binding transcriptional regulator [Planomicrobium stackebrandtii]MDQ0427344.1 LacI family transcriptional regulator/LacI family purine nucleotide synthesis repressor [Planomicrobium stackebrandtii]